MISIIVTICYMTNAEPVCVPVERMAEISYGECLDNRRAIEFLVVRDLLRQGFPLPIMSVTADCFEQA
jgi:hypothetical protein